MSDIELAVYLGLYCGFILGLGIGIIGALFYKNNKEKP
jgi:hypothetical protein